MNINDYVAKFYAEYNHLPTANELANYILLGV